MLIDNKFLYISLPRCGSTSFYYSCILNGLSVQTLNDLWVKNNSKIDFTNIKESEIMSLISHGHDSLIHLKQKFGTHLPIIAVNRDRHETFYSLYKHIIFELNRWEMFEIFKWFQEISLDDLFFYESKDLSNREKRWKVINDYLIKHKFIKKPIHKMITSHDSVYPNTYLINIIDILLTPKSVWHNNDKNIIWFNINELEKMEKWVSDITNTDFKLKHVNSSSHIETKLILNDEFKKRYNSIYDYYDLPKNTKTLI
jgi:hypothetical protein